MNALKSVARTQRVNSQVNEYSNPRPTPLRCGHGRGKNEMNRALGHLCAHIG